MILMFNMPWNRRCRRNNHEYSCCQFDLLRADGNNQIDATVFITIYPACSVCEERLEQDLQ